MAAKRADDCDERHPDVRLVECCPVRGPAADNRALALIGAPGFSRVVLNYAVSADTDGETWRTDLQSDDGTKTRSWHHFLLESAAAALTDLIIGAVLFSRPGHSDQSEERPQLPWAAGRSWGRRLSRLQTNATASAAKPERTDVSSVTTR